MCIRDRPWDDRLDVVEAAKLVSVLPVTEVKLHSLFVVKGTRLAEEFEAGRVRLLPLDEYIHRVVLFLAYVRPDIVMQRIVGRAAGENILKAVSYTHLLQAVYDWCKCNPGSIPPIGDYR